MKLRNKKTGKVVKLVGYVKTGDDRMFFRFEDDNGTFKKEYNSLPELTEEWEDAPEEPKKYWYIDYGGRIKAMNDADDEEDVARKEIGNYFETREEAEKAVEKFKAFKRLKDKGFKFEGWDNTDRSTIHNFSLFVAIEDLDSINKDLDLLFGGEK